MGVDSFNMVLTCDKNWEVTNSLDCFHGKSITDVMDWVKGNCDAFQHNYRMEVIFLPQGCYRVIFSFLS